MTGAAALLTAAFASGCVPTNIPQARWHTCTVPVSGEINSTVDSALKEMTGLTGLKFVKSDLTNATAGGIKFEVGDLPGTTAGSARANFTKGGSTSTITSGVVIWDKAANPPTAPITRHELGHLMGMDHSTTVVMRPAPIGITWTAAERQYLADVGRASGCRS